jgi:hypothetical protein
MAEPGYAVENQPVALDGVTELLVHGVGGESAEHTLHEPHPMLVAGDATAGFYRGPDADGRHRESYSWGGLTSGRASRACGCCCCRSRWPTWPGGCTGGDAASASRGTSGP